MNWDECLMLSRRAVPRYALDEEQRQYVYNLGANGLGAGSVIVELGVCNGVTSVVLAYLAKHLGAFYHGVDSFVLGDGVGERAYRKLLEDMELPYNLHVGNTNDVPWTEPIDLLLIDASHTDPYVSQDCARWLPFLKTGCLAMFHDYDGAPEPLSAHWPVRRAVERHTDLWPMIYYINGLMIKRKQQPEAYQVIPGTDQIRPGIRMPINMDGMWDVLEQFGDGSFLVERVPYSHLEAGLRRYPCRLWKTPEGWMMRQNVPLVS